MKLTITATLSKHNSQQDADHEFRWMWFCDRVRDMAEGEVWRDINLMVD